MTGGKAKAVSASKYNDNSDLARKVRSGEFKIAVYGLGHVGSPLASAWLRAGAHVVGANKSPEVLENARKGKTHVPEPGVNEAFSKGLKNNKFYVYDDPVMASQDAHFKLICVPVLLADSFSAVLAALKQVAPAIGRGTKKGDNVSLDPSVPPGRSQRTESCRSWKRRAGCRSSETFTWYATSSGSTKVGRSRTLKSGTLRL